MTETLTESDFAEVDREALNRALQTVLDGPDRIRAEQVRRFLEDVDQDPDYGWHYAATSAAYDLQCRNLNLKPWESPPCHCDEGSKDEAGKLLRRMLSYGVSRYEPDPVTAIQYAKPT